MKNNSSEMSEFIGKYLDKKMKNHNLPYSFEYLSLLGKHTEDAERKWKAKMKRLASKLNPKQKSFGNGYRKPIKDDMGVLQCLCTNAKPTSNGLGGHTCLKCNANWYH